MKNKKIWLLFVVLLLAIGVTWLIFNSNKYKEIAYIQQHNAFVHEQKKIAETAVKNKTPLQAAREEIKLRAMQAVSEGMVTPIEFYGRVVDQSGVPIEGVEVAYSAAGAPFASGTGEGKAITDANGIFNTRGARGTTLHVSFKKTGYEFKNVDFADIKNEARPLQWSDYADEDKPYIFKAWKTEKYAQVKSEDKRYLSFVPNGPVYTVDFSGEERVKWEGIREGDIRIAFTRNEKDWKVQIDAVNGGIQESSDEYMNLAPESGYQKSLTYSGVAKDSFNVSRGISLNKSMYFMSNNGKRYGSLHLEIIPYYNEKESGIYTTYTVNLEHGRELAVKL